MTLLQIRAGLQRRGFLSLAQAIARQTKVPLEAVLGRGKTKSIMGARRALYQALRDQGLSFPEIGALLDRDHVTILYVLKRRAQRNRKRKPRSST